MRGIGANMIRGEMCRSTQRYRVPNCCASTQFPKDCGDSPRTLRVPVKTFGEVAGGVGNSAKSCQGQHTDLAPDIRLRPAMPIWQGRARVRDNVGNSKFLPAPAGCRAMTLPPPFEPGLN